MSAGNRPNTEWLRGAVELWPDGRIKTDEYMRTSDPDIFAIGDATTVWYNPGKMRMNVSLGTNARRQAHYAVKIYSKPFIRFLVYKALQGRISSIIISLQLV